MVHRKWTSATKMNAESSHQDVTRKTIRILGLCLLAGVLIYLLTKNTESISVAVKDDHLSLSSSSGDSFDISYKDILAVTETPALDPGRYVSGSQTKNYRFGVWKNDEFGEYNLCIYADVGRYIVVKTTAATFVFSLESVDATDSFYTAFLELLQSGQAQATP
jgi:hypothetical protein